MTKINVQSIRNRLTEELRSIASADINDYISADPETGQYKLRPIEDIPSSKRSCLYISKANAKEVEIRVYDKMKAIEQLCKLYGFDRSAENDDSTQKLDRLLALLGGSENDK